MTRPHQRRPRSALPTSQRVTLLVALLALLLLFGLALVSWVERAT